MAGAAAAPNGAGVAPAADGVAAPPPKTDPPPNDMWRAAAFYYSSVISINWNGAMGGGSREVARSIVVGVGDSRVGGTRSGKQ